MNAKKSGAISYSTTLRIKVQNSRKKASTAVFCLSTTFSFKDGSLLLPNFALLSLSVGLDLVPKTIR